MKKIDKQDPFFLIEDLPCPYIEDGRIASLEFTFPAEGLVPNFHTFLARGYRRLGSVIYRNVCRGCSSCRPIRLETEKFVASKSQKRTMRKNNDVRIECRTPSVTQAKLDLYGRYVSSKHPHDQGTDIGDCSATLSGLHHSYPGSIEMDYFLGENLIAVGIVDEGADALSSTYFYYDTEHLDRRPGIFSILQEIALARSLGKKYYYLGFYLEETSKMSYKQFFRPNQIYDGGKWRDFLVR